MLALILIMAIFTPSIISVKPTFAYNSSSTSNLPTPSVPEFTVKFENYSYTLQPIYSENPYTGQTEQTNPSAGEYRENESIEVIIQNQPFTPSWTIVNAINYTINLYFDVDTKGHFSQNWTDPGPGGYQVEDYASRYTDVIEYTNSIPSSGQIDFQVQAFIGYVYTNYTGPPSSYGYAGLEREFTEYLFNGTESGWSNTQTVSIPANIPLGSTRAPTSSASTSPTVTPQNPTTGTQTKTEAGFNWIEVALFMALAVIVALVVVVVSMTVRQRKTAHPNPF